MSTKILGLRTTAYLVSDIDAAKDWYTKAFGISPYFDEPFYVGFNIGGYELGLMPDKKPATKKSGGVYAYWGVENIDEVYSKFLDMGAIAHEAPQNVGGELMISSVKDPWGNIIGFIYNPEFKIED